MPAQRNGSPLDPIESEDSGSQPILINNERTTLLEIKSDITFKTKIAFAVGHVLNDICASLWFTYTLLFLHAVIGMPGRNAGAILLLGQVVDALATPLVGMLADRPLTGRLAKYGRRKLCHLLGTTLVLISFPFIFIPCIPCDTPIVPRYRNMTTPSPWAPLPSPGSMILEPEPAWWQQTVFYSPFVIIFQIGWAAVQIAHLSLIPELTSSDQGRTELTAVRFSMSEVSTVTVYFVTWSVLHVTRKNAIDQIQASDAYKFRNIVLICMSLGVVFSMYFHIFLKEPAPRAQQPVQEQELLIAESPKNEKRKNKQPQRTAAQFFTDPRLYQAAFLYVCSRLFNTLTEVFIPLYMDESLGENAESLALVPLTIDIASFIASLFVKILNKNCGRTFSYLLGAMFALLANVWIHFGHGESYQNQQIYLVAILLGCGTSITLVTSLCITADLIGENTNSGAVVYSAVTFTDKLLNGLAVMIIEALKCDSYALCPHYYRDAIVLVCGGTVMFGLIVLASYSKCRLDY